MDERKLTLFIEEGHIRVVHDSDDARATHAIEIDGPCAPGDARLTDEQAKALYRILGYYYKGKAK